MEERDMSQDWIVDLAGTLISEIFYTMSKISLWLIPEIPALEALDAMDSVLGVASSEHCGMRMQIRSGYGLFERLARNMIGGKRWRSTPPRCSTSCADGLFPSCVLP